MSDNPDTHHQRNGPNDISSDMEFSILLSRSLDVLGYNQNIVRHRVYYQKVHERLRNLNLDKFEIVYAGSQKKGVVAGLGNDLDMMTEYKHVICADDPRLFIGIRQLTLFKTDSCDTEPGYTTLKLIRIKNGESDIADSLFHSDNGNIYISSSLLKNSWLETSKKVHKNNSLSTTGPAVPFYFPLTPNIVHDLVPCFKCFNHTLLRPWLRRPRPNNWPPPNIIRDIHKMEANVVLVGCKGSDTYHQEWRICFTRAEIYLVHSFNDTQIKLYVVLKMIAKTILKNICPEITSYIIKNIVFWMCESLPSELFTEHQLVNRIFQGFEYVNKCVLHNYLPSYMIPERNLFRGRLELVQKIELTKSLSSFIEEGPVALVHRLAKIWNAKSVLYREPQKAEFYRIKRNIIEKLLLLRNLRHDLNHSDMTEVEAQFLSGDELYENMTEVIINLVFPEWREMHNAQDTFNERLRQYLS